MFAKETDGLVEQLIDAEHRNAVELFGKTYKDKFAVNMICELFALGEKMSAMVEAWKKADIPDELIQKLNTRRTQYLNLLGCLDYTRLKWIKTKKTPMGNFLLTEFVENKSVFIIGELITLERIFKDCTFLDGSPCGIME